MAFYKRSLTKLLSGLVLVAGLGLNAQTPTPPKPFTVAVHGPAPSDLKIEVAPGKVESVEFRLGERSREYVSRVPGPIVFFTETPGPNAAMPPSRTRIAQVVVPADVKRALLLFVANSQSAATPADRYRILVLEDSLEKFPPASVRFFNASGLKLDGLAGRNQISFGPGITDAFPAKSSLRVQLAMMHRDRYLPSFDQEIQVEDTQRLICILLPPESPKSPLVRWAFISDYISPPKPPPAK